MENNEEEEKEIWECGYCTIEYDDEDDNRYVTMFNNYNLVISLKLFVKADGSKYHKNLSIFIL